MKITITVDGQEPFETTLEKFARCNDDAISERTIKEWRALLRRGISIREGGGAGVAYIIDKV